MANIDVHDILEETLKVECRTIDTPELCNNHIQSLNFKVLALNIRSLNQNFDKLLPYLIRLKSEFDVLVFSECWLQENSQVPVLHGYNVYHTGKTVNKCGGVTIYVKDCWSSTAYEPNFQDANCLVVNVAKSLEVCGIYRSPAVNNLDKFNESLGNLLSSTKDCPTVLVIGDMNIDLLQEPPSRGNEEYQCVMAENGFLPAITEATRRKACLDHAYIRTKNKALGLICKCSVTDHDLLLVGLTSKLKNSKEKTRVFTKTNYHNVAKDLQNIVWKTLLETDDVNAAANELHKTITECINRHTQERQISRSKYVLKAWITPGLLRCIRHRDNLHLKLRRNPKDEILKLTYHRYKNFCNNLLRKLKVEHDNKQLAQSSGNPRELWKAIKSVCDFPIRKSDADEIISKTSDHQDAIDNCNRHFATTGSKLASNILKKLETTQAVLCRKIAFGSCCQNSLYLAPTDNGEITKIIQELNPSSAPGEDNITPLLLKYSRSALLEPLTHICNLSMASGTFPDRWKIAVITPVHKSGDKTCPDNYRPIALLSILSKILEKLVNKRLTDFLDKHSLLSDHQYGFRHGKSTEDAVQFLTETISSHLDRGQRCIGVFLDLARAFDSLSTKILLKKLERFGIRGVAQNWFSSYLSNRRQYVRIGKCRSSEMNIDFGLPQGSILAPILFTIYVDGILRLNLPNAEIICYADDTAAIFHGSTWEAALKEAEKGLAELSRWLDDNLLTLNTRKTNFVTFHITGATDTDLTKLCIHNGNCRNVSATNATIINCQCISITRVDHTKYLGVIVDQNLTFKKHISYIAKKARKLIYIMKALRQAANYDMKMLVYKSLCQSLFQYCVGVWGGAATTHMAEVERAQRAVLKVLMGKPRRYSTEALFKETSVLTVRQLFVLRAIAKTHYLSASQVISKRKRHRDHRLPRINTVFASRLPKYVHIFTYNSVCRNIDIQHSTFSQSKQVIKKWLISLSFEQTEKLVKFSEMIYKATYSLSEPSSTQRPLSTNAQHIP